MIFFGTKHTLYTLVTAPTVWAIHFLIAYPTAAVMCVRVTPQAGLGPARIVIAVVTVLALAIITATGTSGWRHSGGVVAADDPLDDDTDGSRQRFLANATLLLAGLSFVGVVYVALPAVIFESCR